MKHSNVSVVFRIILHLLFIHAALGSPANQAVEGVQYADDSISTPPAFRGRRLVTESTNKKPDNVRGFSSAVYDAICKNKIATHVVQPKDDGKSISLKYYPQDDIQETWSFIIACNAVLRSSYSNATEVSFAVPYPTATKLRIPDKGETIRGLVLQTGLVSPSSGVMEDANQEFLCGCGEEIVVSKDTKLGKLRKNLFNELNEVLLVLCNPHIQMKKSVVLSGQTLKVPCTEDEMRMKLDFSTPVTTTTSITTATATTAADDHQDILTPTNLNISDYQLNTTTEHYNRQLIATRPQNNDWNRWDAYSCTHSMTDDYGANAWIFKGSDPECERMFQKGRLYDGCSSPVWGAYTHNFEPACNNHDFCYQLSWWKDSSRWPQTVQTRDNCDWKLREMWQYACQTRHCGPWWKAAECGACYATLDIWYSVLWDRQKGKITPAGSWLTPEEQQSLRQYSGASIYTPYRAMASIRFADVFRQSRGEIRSRWNNKCLDVDRERVHMYDCHGGWNQQWYRPGGNMQDMRIQVDGNKCLDALGGQGERVAWLWCHDVRSNQRWVYDDKYRLHSVRYPELCLDIYAYDGNNYAKVVMWPCNDQPNQQWYQP